MGPRSERTSVVLVCVPGLERVLGAEATALGVRTRSAGPGALSARVTDRQLYLVNYALTTATRVLIEVAELTARSFSQLEDRLREVDLSPWIGRGEPVRVRVTSSRSKLHHTGAIEERFRRTLHLGEAPDDQPGARPRTTPAMLVVRVDHDHVEIRVDSSGAPLHHRGWRGPQAKAPLRETLAAAALNATGWEPGHSLVDPFAGSGTIAIEAARRVAGIAPGAHRAFAFEQWPTFAPGTWASVKASTRPASDGAGADTGAGTDEPSVSDAAILAADRDRGAVAAIVENAERGGVGHLVTAAEASVSTLTAPDGAAGWVITNPPWGNRVAGKGRGGASDVRDLYARLGQVFRAGFGGWGLAVLVPDLALAGHVGLGGGEVLWRSRSGPTPVHLVALARPA